MGFEQEWRTTRVKVTTLLLTVCTSTVEKRILKKQTPYGKLVKTELHG